MAAPKSAANENEISRDRLAELLNEDLAREYQAIIAYVVYSQVLSGAEYMDIAAQLEIHAKQELDHALILSRQIDYLGKMPVVTPKPVRTSKKPKDMLRYDLDNENETIRNYRDRIRQCEALGEFAMAEQIRQILMQEQDHQIDLATALGIEFQMSAAAQKDASWASGVKGASWHRHKRCRDLGSRARPGLPSVTRALTPCGPRVQWRTSSQRATFNLPTTARGYRDNPQSRAPDRIAARNRARRARAKYHRR